MIKTAGDDFKLLVIIVEKKITRKVIKACKKAGAEGDTVIRGRGTGLHDPGSIFGVKVEREKSIILILVPDTYADSVLDAATNTAKLNEPGTGIAFMLNSKSICGVSHLLKHYS